MKRLMLYVLCSMLCIGTANAYQLVSSRELGQGEAKNQNIVVRCTTVTGGISNEQCQLRRFAKCTTRGGAQVCDGWLPWRDLRNPNREFGDWRAAADACCRAKGLR